MRKRKLTKMTTLFLMTALSAAAAFTGCGKKSVDYNVDDNENGGSSGDGGELASRLGIPESCDDKLDVGDSELDSIKIEDDSIEVPSTDSMAVVSYKRNTFDNDYRQKVCEAVFDKSKGIYIYDWENQTKDDIQSQIDTYQTMLEEAQASGDSDTESYCKEYISYLEEELTTAKDERDGAGDYSASDFIGYVGENQYLLSFSESSEGLSASFDLSYYPSEGLINYKPHEGASFVYAYNANDAYTDEEDSEDGDTTEATDTANSCTFTEEEAISLAEQFLSSCGIDDVMVTSKDSLVWEYYDSSYNVIATEYDGYEISFGRSINGTAPYSSDLSMVDTLSSDDDTWYEANTETFTVQIDSNGVFAASCYPLLTSTGEESKNVDLLSWDDLLKSLNENIGAYYTENTTSYKNIEFNDIRLTYYSIKDDSQEDVYNYTPVWIFAQADEYDGTYDYDYPVQAIIVNATDGSIYNLKDVLAESSISYEDYIDDTIDIDEDTYSSDDELIDDEDIVVEESSETDDADETITDDETDDIIDDEVE